MTLSELYIYAYIMTGNESAMYSPAVQHVQVYPSGSGFALYGK
jgi:hypothetical protein